MKRLFIAFTIPPEVAVEIERIQAELSKQNRCEPIRWVGGNYHITFVFLGDCGDETEARLKEKLSELKDFDFFKLELKRLEVFPNLHRPRVLVIKCRDESGGSLRLHLKLKELAGRCGVYLTDRGFKPHITLGRIKGHCVRVRGVEKIELEPISFFIDKVMLFSSQLLPDGPCHTPLLEIKLAN